MAACNSSISAWKNSFKKTVQRFNRNENGQFAVIFAVSSVALTLASGVALDAARLYSAKAKLNHAIDAAVLATTRDLTTGVIAEEDAEDAVSKFLYANMNANGVAGVPVQIDDIDVDSTNKTLEIDAHLMLPMTLTAIAGWNDVKVASSSKAVFADERIEIAMALDVTGSMNDPIGGASTKMAALKLAATNAINTLVPAGTASQRVRIGLVPYSASVNITPVKSKIFIEGDSEGCVIERTTKEAYSNHFASYNHPVNGYDKDPSHYNCPESEIVPMTNSNAKLTNTISGLGTDGYTAGHVGIAWAQYMLSSNWNMAWPGDVKTGSDAAPASENTTRKFAIIMTDGEFNTFLTNGKGGGNGANESSDYAKALCDNMKNGNITVFTINFAGGTNAANLMKECATPNTAGSQYYFNADNSGELQDAFEAISEAISSLRLVS